MYRCALATLAVATALIAPAAEAQVRRNFPQNALRGELKLLTAYDAELNGNAVRLAPGVRIRDTRNMLALSGGLLGQKFVVNYTVDPQGLLREVWLLREDEIKVFWPRSTAEAQRFQLDPVAQTWTKR